MRLRFLLLTMLLVLLGTAVVNSWPWGPKPYGHEKRVGGASCALTVSASVCTNGSVTVEVKNVAGRTVFLHSYVEIEYRSPVDDSDYFSGECVSVLPTSLPPGGSCRASVPRTTQLHWRAVVSEQDERIMNAMRMLGKLPSWTWPFIPSYSPQPRVLYAVSPWNAP